ncbi:MAG: hypothetical protein J6127_03855 [Clostridiales bacterium]|nr:hypothetical protein [Clostridiales bacterium]
MTIIHVYYIIYIVFSLLFAGSVVVYFIGHLLDKSNNLGDTYGRLYDYSPSGSINLIAERLDISMASANAFLEAYDENPYEQDNSKAPEALKINENEDIYGELPDVDIPLFKPKSE